MGEKRDVNFFSPFIFPSSLERQERQVLLRTGMKRVPTENSGERGPIQAYNMKTRKRGAKEGERTSKKIT